MCELLASLGSQLPCKSHIFNFKSDVSQPITGVQYFGIFQKKVRKTHNFSKLSQMSKVISRASCIDMRSFLVKWGSYERVIGIITF